MHGATIKILSPSSTLKMEAVNSYETLLHFYHIIRYRTAQGGNLHSHL